jgi:hypothetical protein
MAQRSSFVSGTSASNATTFQPVLFSRPSMSLLRVSHSEFWGEACGMAGEEIRFQAKYL